MGEDARVNFLQILLERRKLVKPNSRKSGEIYRGFKLGIIGARQVDAWYLWKEGKTYEEIGQIMQIKKSTVYSYISLVNLYAQDKGINAHRRGEDA